MTKSTLKPNTIAIVGDPKPMPAPGRKTAANPVWICIADGIWKNTRAKQPWLYERPVIGGRATFKALGTTLLKQAKLELARRLTQRFTGTEPPPNEPDRAVTSGVATSGVATGGVMAGGVVTGGVVTGGGVTGGDVIRAYQRAGYPDKRLNPRPAETQEMESSNCEMLLRFWENILMDKCRDQDCDDYRAWRIEQLTRKSEGTRMVDLDLNTMNNAARFAKRRGLVSANPFADRLRYHDPKKVRHCRECMPKDADDLHAIAAPLFAHPRSVALGFQFLAEAMTGLRTCEVLKWGADDFGSLTPDGRYIRVWRSKGQHNVNPYCANHEGLQAVLKAHALWKKIKFPNSPCFFPSAKDPSQPVGGDSLAHTLGRLRGKKVTSHGARAFFVTIRRSQGVSDAQIAFEIGHTTGGSTLAKVYGGVPPNWLTGDAPKMGWLPVNTPLAWAASEARNWDFQNA